MKKLIAILFSTMIVVALSACSAADDSTITSPRMTQNTPCTLGDDCDEDLD